MVVCKWVVAAAYLRVVNHSLIVIADTSVSIISCTDTFTSEFALLQLPCLCRAWVHRPVFALTWWCHWDSRGGLLFFILSFQVALVFGVWCTLPAQTECWCVHHSSILVHQRGLGILQHSFSHAHPPRLCRTNNPNTTQALEYTKDKYNAKIIKWRVSPKVPPTTYKGWRMKWRRCGRVWRDNNNKM
jgi:hypothetical protein